MMPDDLNSRETEHFERGLALYLRLVGGGHFYNHDDVVRAFNANY